MASCFLLVAAVAVVAAQDATTVEIAKGVHMPRLNLGTCCGSTPETGVPAWFAAGGVGIDTAWDYKDQSTIAKMLKASGKKRSEYFITSKVPAGLGAHAGNRTDCRADPQIALNYVKDDLKQLGLEYVDLVLLHGPCRFANPAVPNATVSDNALWKGLQMAMAQGLTRAIGVSNYMSSELAALEEPAPSVNQCQMSVGKCPSGNPWGPNVAHDDDTIKYCQSHGITYESWRSVGGCPMSHPKVTAIAKAHQKSVAQICLRWVLQRGAIIASGTGHTKVEEYSKEDFQIFNFTLTDSEMSTLDGISPPSAEPSLVV